MEFLKRTWTEISLDNLGYNYRQIRSGLPEGTGIVGVVKADAYGHGAVQIGRQLAALGASFLAVSNLEEAEQLHKAGIAAPILLLGYTPPEFAAFSADRDFRQEVNSLDYARALDAALRESGKRLKIHLKVDTGMSRLGFFAYDRAESAEEIAELSKLEHLEIEGIFQHFCVADSHEEDCRAFTELQYGRFCAFLEELAGRGVSPRLRHCCNSAAAILHPEYGMEMVRPGIAMYGCAPDPGMKGDVELRPLLSWRTTVVQVRDFAPGIAVSYGRTWKTERPSKIAVLPVGYADGLSRGLSNRVEFLLHGQRIRQVGRICMDMCMADVTDVAEVRVGDTVTILGRDGEQEIRCEEMAELAGTIPYEITCCISKRVPRIYTRHGREVGRLQYIK